MRFGAYLWRRWIGRDLTVERHCEIRSARTWKCGRDVSVGRKTTIDRDVTVGDEVVLGDNVFIDSGVVIGDRTVVGRLSSLMTKTHTPQTGSSRRRSGDIVSVGTLQIGSDVVIGARVLILPQVRTIGAGACIKDGSVVTRDVAPGEVWIGYP